MELRDYLETATEYLKAMLLPIEGIHAYTPVEKKDEIYTFHPYLFRHEYSSSYIDDGTYYASHQKQFDVFTPEIISYLSNYGVKITEVIESSSKYYGYSDYSKYYNLKYIKNITTVTIDATLFTLPHYIAERLDLSEKIKLIKKVYLDYLKIYSKMNRMNNNCKPKWFHQQLDAMKKWADELIEYLI